MYDTIKSFLRQLQADAEDYQPEDDRITALEKMAVYIQQKVHADKDVALNFICTHNSRRSHLSQIWAQTIANFFELPRIYCYSGGTESTSIYPQVVKTLEEQGFQQSSLSREQNPVHVFKFSPTKPGVIGFSKKYDHPFNPTTDFAAIMTCSQADEGCPFVAGADARFSLPYKDPKEADDTPDQAKIYKERSQQIAADLFYVFKTVHDGRKTR